MTNRLEINWKMDGFIDEQRYYCSESPLDPENLPPQKAVLAGDIRTYIDTAIDYGKTYHSIISSVKNSVEKFSKIRSADTLRFQNEFLIFADAKTFPSSTFTDSSLKLRPVSRSGGVSIVNSQVKLHDEGWIKFDGTSNYLSTVLASPLNLDDFTLESYVNPDYGKATQYGRLFAIGTHSTNGMISVSKSGDPWMLNIDTYSNGWGAGTKVSTPPVLQNGQIRHVCLMRKNGIFYLFVNGVLAATKSDSLAFSLSQTKIYIGTHPYNNNTAFDSFGGFMSSIRLTRFARYSESGFTPPNYKFPA